MSIAEYAGFGVFALSFASIIALLKSRKPGSNKGDAKKKRKIGPKLKTTGQLHNSEFPMDEEGRTYHVNTKRGEVANRIIMVGDLNRAKLYAEKYLDRNCKVFSLISGRGFATYTGKYKGVPVTIMGVGMGLAMIDFAIRETLAVIDGDVAIVRLGTCGTPRKELECGTIVIANNSTLITRNPNAFRRDPESQKIAPYNFHTPTTADAELTGFLHKYATMVVGKENVKGGLNATADLFYASQGRVSPFFNDKNEHLIEDLLKKYPEVSSLEMETFHLFDMAECSKGRIKAAAAAIVLAQRTTGDFIDMDLKHKREKQLGKIGLEALISVKLENVAKDGVWNEEI